MSRHAKPALETNRVPAAHECVLRDMLEGWSRKQPEKVFVQFHGGPAVTYAGMQAMAEQTAAALFRLGVRQDDTVLVWMPNGIDCLRLWFAINWLGATYVPINTAYRGGLLEHVVRLSDARLMLAHHELLPRLDGLSLGRLQTVVAMGGPPRSLKDIGVLDQSHLQGDQASLPALERPIKPWDPQSIIFTSGTTGPSKAVLSSYAHLHTMSGQHSLPMLTGDDRYMLNLPLFHVGGTIAVAAMLARGGSLAMVTQFSTAAFWDSVRDTGTTFTLLLGAMAGFISDRPPVPEDRGHTLRHVVIIPLLAQPRAFAERFSVDVYTFYNMSEISVPILSEANPDGAGLCGRARAGVTLRLVDEHDCEVPPGAAGQLIIRTDAPWALATGYHNNPEATAAAWRNGWFHTGDAFRVEDGVYYFVDRLKDAIRRRGENISSFEVEREVLAHPAIREAAVVPVPAGGSEDELLCVVVLHPGTTVDPAALIRFLEPRLAHFMLPRYIRVLDDLPRTPTQKIEKYVLRRQGLAPGTWDREAAGIQIRRQPLSETDGRLDR